MGAKTKPYESPVMEIVDMIAENSFFTGSNTSGGSESLNPGFEDIW